MEIIYLSKHWEAAVPFMVVLETEEELTRTLSIHQHLTIHWFVAVQGKMHTCLVNLQFSKDQQA